MSDKLFAIFDEHNICDEWVVDIPERMAPLLNSIFRRLASQRVQGDHDTFVGCVVCKTVGGQERVIWRDYHRASINPDSWHLWKFKVSSAIYPSGT